MTNGRHLVTSFKLLEDLGEDAWEINLETGDARASTRFWGRLGYDPALAPVTREAARQLFHPADARLAREELALHLQSKEPFEFEIRIRAADGEWRFLRFRGCVTEWDGRGRPRVIGGTLTDLTDLVFAARTQRHAKALVASLSNRERQVLDCLLVGAASKNIAHALNLSQRTVEAYRARLMAKMEVKGVGQLVQIALSGGATRGAQGSCGGDG